MVALSQDMAAIGVSPRGRPEAGSPVPVSRVPQQSEFEQSPCGTSGLEVLSTVAAVDLRHSSSGEHTPLAGAGKWSNTPVASYDLGAAAKFGRREQLVQVPCEDSCWQHSAPPRPHYHSAGDLTSLPLELQPGGPDRSILPSTLTSVQEDDVASDTDKVSTVYHTMLNCGGFWKVAK